MMCNEDHKWTVEADDGEWFVMCETCGHILTCSDMHLARRIAMIPRMEKILLNLDLKEIEALIQSYTTEA